ncbi:gamma-aminobutyric acid receptor subunit beta-like [Haliotis rubra]|uniref:gamma-aminobutyric acid receptor subunit beta-like n=1 Tax=Haliotis rubra TaxID=36100 RepID=UPI001EE55E8C|nr:gamma-aminobutyric acid receptor subunit beta-like [Haliotis rubra]
MDPNKPLADTFRRMSVTLDQNSQVLLSSLQTMKDITGDPTSGFHDIVKAEKVTVELKCAFLKIVDIDTITQQFQAEIFVQAKWEEPAFSKPQGKANKLPKFDPKIHWDPKLLILNCEDMCLDRKTFSVRHDQNYKHPVVLQLWRFKGTFRENMELEHFPFDVQDLTIQVGTERPINKIELIEDQHMLSTVNTYTFLDAQEWNIYNHVESFRDKTTMEYASLSSHPILHVQCRVKRKVGFYIWNIIVIMILIVSLTFTVVSIEPNNGDRISICITLFLTAVAFKLVVKQSLPTISYLTYLDIYILSLLIFLSVQAAENAFMCALGRVLPIKVLRTWDRWSESALAVLLLLFHILFGIYIQHTALKRRRIMKDKDKLYEKKKQYTEQYGRMMTNAGFSPGRRERRQP